MTTPIGGNAGGVVLRALKGGEVKANARAFSAKRLSKVGVGRRSLSLRRDSQKGARQHGAGLT